MTIAAKARDLLPVCGDCKNAKVIIWRSTADKEQLRTSSHVEIDGDFYFFKVQCGWLKGAVPVPLELLKCEGKVAY